MHGSERPILIVADSYQFLDTVCGATPATLQEWRVASSLEALESLAIQSPLAIVIDLEARGFDPREALERLRSLRVSAPLVLLSGPDLSVLNAIRHSAALDTFDVAGSLRRPLMMTALLKLLQRHCASSSALTPTPAETSALPET